MVFVDVKHHVYLLTYWYDSVQRIFVSREISSRNNSRYL